MIYDMIYKENYRIWRHWKMRVKKKIGNVNMERYTTGYK
jgi:hypothetical protein